MHALGTMGSGSKNAASAPAASTLAPPLTDPYSWFDYYDKDASNSLDQEEVVTGLLNTIQTAAAASAAADKKKKKSSSTADDSSTSTVDDIRESIQAIWPAFDLDGNGQVSACGKPSSYVYIPTYLIRADAFRSSHDRLTEKNFALLAGWQRACSPLPVVTSHRTKPRRPAADSSRRIITDDPRAVAIPAPGPAAPLAAVAIPVLGRSNRHTFPRQAQCLRAVVE